MEELISKNLLYTERGKEWLSQFSDADKLAAQNLVSSLALVSHLEFNRNLQSLLENESSGICSPAAIFAIREVKKNGSFFSNYTDPKTGLVSALPVGTDYGSEARIAALIRNVCKGDKVDKLNHPSIAVMRKKQCRTIVMVDDFIGSGNRVCKFLDSFLEDKTIASWLSLKYLRLVVITYSGTSKGVKAVRKHRAKPEILFVRDCPDLAQLPYKLTTKKDISSVCKRYARRTNRSQYWDGYGHSMTTMVFEHGCPNNAPAILWAEKYRYKHWKPLFPNRVVLTGETSVFPSEVLKPDAAKSLINIGQTKLATSGALLRRGEMGINILLILALVAQGHRKRSTLSYTTGLNVTMCSRIIEKCISWEFITRSFRLTPKGKAELSAAKRIVSIEKKLPEIGDSCYYPTQLRGVTFG